jgi:hypothetical protein
LKGLQCAAADVVMQRILFGANTDQYGSSDNSAVLKKIASVHHKTILA